MNTHHQHDHGHAHHLGAVQPASTEGSSTNADAVLKDPVCGMTVTEQSFHRSSHMGHTFFFCGPKCKAKFDANPMGFMAGHAHTPVHVASPAGAIYTCPMHPDVRQDHPGTCPKCGMALEPMAPALEEEENPELQDFQRRFWWTLPQTAIVFVLAMVGHRLQ